MRLGRQQRSVFRLFIAAIFCAVLFRCTFGSKDLHPKHSDIVQATDEKLDTPKALPLANDYDSESHSFEQQSRFAEKPSPFLEDDEDIAEDEEVERVGDELAELSGSGSGTEAPLPVTTPTTGLSPAGVATAAAPSVEDSTADGDVDENGGGQGAQPQGDLLSALQQASQPEGSSDFIGGVRTTRPGSTAASGAGAGAAPPAQATASPTPVDLRSWVAGQARGYTMLYAMQPQARPVVEAHVQTLLEARIREPYVGILIDGTFGEDIEYVKSIITRLSAEGRKLVLALFLSNGPTMRVYDSTPIDALFSRIKPESFRSRIFEEVELQSSYAAVVDKARALFEFSRQVSSANAHIAVVMLEDNLTTDTYQFMREIVRERLVGVDVSIVRNPCVGCYRGNDGDTGGDPREEHEIKRFVVLEKGDGFSLDGTGFNYPGDASSEGLSSADLLQLMRDSMQRGLRYVGLWRFPWQGLTPGGGKPHPSERNYVPSSETERAFEIDVLREGLTTEAVTN
jgi:hypothetical protein